MKLFNMFKRDKSKSYGLYAKLSGSGKTNFTVDSRFEEELKTVFKDLILKQKFTVEFDHFINLGIRIESAAEFCEFIPTLFCREIFPETKYAESYLVRCFDGEVIRERYQENPFYRCIEKYCNQFFRENDDLDILKHVAKYSVECQFLCIEIKKGYDYKDYRLTEKTIF